MSEVATCPLCGHPRQHHYRDKAPDVAMRYECYECNSETTLTGRTTPCYGSGAVAHRS